MEKLIRSFATEKLEALDPWLRRALEDKPWKRALLNSLALKGSWYFDHSIRVGFIANRLGRFKGLYQLDQRLLFEAGVFHDIGKVAIPYEILNKESLEPWEKLILDTHPKIGYELIRPFDETIAKIIVAHHEFQDKSYPRKKVRKGGLEKLQNILALADKTDALLSDRPYKKGWTRHEAFLELSKTFDGGVSMEAVDIYYTFNA